jgi:hypothetical protein
MDWIGHFTKLGLRTRGAGYISLQDSPKFLQLKVLFKFKLGSLDS